MFKQGFESARTRTVAREWAQEFIKSRVSVGGPFQFVVEVHARLEAFSILYACKTTKGQAEASPNTKAHDVLSSVHSYICISSQPRLASKSIR